MRDDIKKLLNDVRLLLLDVDTPTREQRSDIVHRIAEIAGKPCDHHGCHLHVSHPCERCGTQWDKQKE